MGSITSRPGETSVVHQARETQPVEQTMSAPLVITKLCKRMDKHGILEVAATDNVEDDTYSFRAKILVFRYQQQETAVLDLVRRHWRLLTKYVIEDHIYATQHTHEASKVWGRKDWQTRWASVDSEDTTEDDVPERSWTEDVTMYFCSSFYRNRVEALLDLETRLALF
ncbi:hypothetical protein K491DRAFT_685121 [Lophiostoma macrostomum CBS 122681]|uniref:Uncharacterized protein n=1 Tax=Lophiostoma macrostomum CBS 122681 TaxID=1314788 RepID=A0A6A6SMT9_9PLEO|nr:hypothetical protein K491DRAFT_685121 [Lophiostoma macrostomum CBS 122681]